MQCSLRTNGSVFLLTLLSFLSLTVAFAQEPETRAAERAENRAAAREERQAMLETRLQERIVNLISNVNVRLTSVIDRFGNIIARLDTRIEKLRTTGVNTESAEAKLSEAKRLLVDTSIALENAPSARTAMGGGTPRESFQAVKKDILAVREGLRGVHVLLTETVALLKESVREAELGRGVSEAVRADAETSTEPANEPVTSE